jgi:hypothetical protein
MPWQWRGAEERDVIEIENMLAFYIEDIFGDR